MTRRRGDQVLFVEQVADASIPECGCNADGGIEVDGPGSVGSFGLQDLSQPVDIEPGARSQCANADFLPTHCGIEWCGHSSSPRMSFIYMYITLYKMAANS
ncbi:MAG TPA: hypothetical protein VJ841_00700 [Candidatus Saccharimonadales bacterium]|nr:hypothetical protein [Candidatus Saccharimonadales bacterium]